MARDFTGFDDDLIPILEEVENDLIPLIEKWGWKPINEAMLHDRLYAMRSVRGRGPTQ